jgi:Family of unknown function (DUF6134)
MLRRSFLLATGATFCGGITRADGLPANGLPYGPSLSFAAHRNGQPIGIHSLAFREEAGRRIVVTQIDFTVHMIGMVAYRYTHRCQEIWAGDQFQAVVTETNDNGERYAVQAQQEGGALVVRRREPQSFIKTSGGDEAVEQHWIHEVHRRPILPSTNWNIAQVRQRELLNTQTGKITEVAVRELGRETVQTASGAPPATHYAYSGEFDMQQWFDDHARWVKSTFKAKTDGSTIDYILQG